MLIINAFNMNHKPLRCHSAKWLQNWLPLSHIMKVKIFGFYLSQQGGRFFLGILGPNL